MRFVKESLIRAEPERVFAFHQLPDALERLIPPWDDVTVIQKADITIIGSRAILETRLFGLIRTRWIAEHTAYEPPRLFEDVQISGPFKKWRHQHLFIRHTGGTMLRDEVEYEPPLSFLSSVTAPLIIEPKLKKMFDYRHEVTRTWCESPESTSADSLADPPGRIGE